MKAEAVEEVGGASRHAAQKQEVNRGFSILGLILRVLAAIGALASAFVMGTTSQTLSFFTQFIFRARYNDLPMFTYFVIVNSVVCGYLVLSLPISIFHIIRSVAKISRTVLIIFDTIMLALLTSGASAATAIVYLAHQGNANANWNAICQQFNSFCERASGSLVGSFAAIVLLMLMVGTSAVVLSRC